MFIVTQTYSSSEGIFIQLLDHLGTHWRNPHCEVWFENSPTANPGMSKLFNMGAESLMKCFVTIAFDVLLQTTVQGNPSD
jgi:hypothetical protein